MPGEWGGFQAAEVSSPASGVNIGVAVQYFPPKATLRNAEPKVFSWYGGEVHHHQDLIISGDIPADPTDAALLRVVAIDPFEAPRVSVAFMEGGFLAVETDLS